MTRRIVTVSRQAAGGQPPPDNYPARVVKYVPADIIAAWLALTALLSGDRPEHPAALWVLFAAMVALTPLWTVRVTRQRHEPPARVQAAVSTVAFAVWVFATGVPFASLSFYDPAYGGAAIVLFTLVSGLVIPHHDIPRHDIPQHDIPQHN